MSNETGVRTANTLILVLLAISIEKLAWSQNSPRAEGSLQILEALEEVKQSLHKRVADGVVTVELVRRDLPSGLLSALERCTTEAQVSPWRHGKITDGELKLWHTWCDSFLTFIEKDLFGMSEQGALPAVEDWSAYFGRVFDAWVSEASAGTEEVQETFARFTEGLKANLDRLGRKLERNGVPKKHPVILRQSTGFLIDRGIVVTTKDLARGLTVNDRIRVYSSKQVAYSTGEILGDDPETSIAVIRLASPGCELEPTVKFPIEDEPAVGSFVFTFYHAFNQLSLSMRTGEITGVNRQVPIFHCATFHETSLPTSPGTLGAPLVNLKGDLVGMGNVFMAQGTMSEITFAVPASQLRVAADQIIQRGCATRGCIGVYLNEAVREGRTGRIVIVSGLVPDGPASRNGIRSGDIILSLNGKDVHCRMSLLSALSHYRANDMITLAIERNDRPVTVKLPLAPLADTLER